MFLILEINSNQYLLLDLTGKSPIADFTFGWNTFLQVGKFDLRTVWRASVGNYAFNNVKARYATLKFIDSDGFGLS